MLRIAGVTLPNNKRLEAALPYLYGVGFSSAKKILAATGVDPNVRTNDVSEEDANKLRTYTEQHYKLEGALRQQVMLDIKRLKEIESYRGNRHSRHLPVRGQRTRTNSRTLHGNVRKTAGSGRKKSADKT